MPEVNLKIRNAGDVKTIAESLRATHVEWLAEQIEAQMPKPAIEEPREFGSVVRVVHQLSAQLHFCRTYSVDVDKPWCSGNHMRSWADVIDGAIEVEVLRVGLGEIPSDSQKAAQDDAFMLGVQNGREQVIAAIRTRIRALLADAITSERKNALEKAIQAVEELAP